MFSDHLEKIDHASGKTLFFVASGLVIVCQLVAVVLVAQGQVEKAEARDVRQASDSTATAWCVQTSHGADIKGCANRQIVAKPDDRSPVIAAARD